MKKFKIAIVGATGAVGREMLRCVFQFNFPFESIKLLASPRSAGKEVEYTLVIYKNDDLFTLEKVSVNNQDATKINESDTPIADKYCISLEKVKIRYIDPLVNGERMWTSKSTFFWLTFFAYAI